MGLTKETLHSLFNHISRHIVRDGQCIKLAVYGGSCLVLASNFRNSTKDVDGVCFEHQAYVDDLAKKMATDNHLSSDWLNDGVRTYLSPNVDELDEHIFYERFGEGAEAPLEIYVPSPAYLFAMKVMAMRISHLAGNKDLSDLINLMSVLKLDDPRQVVDIASRFYPEACASGKILLNLPDLWNSYLDLKGNPDAPAPLYLGRSHDALSL